MNEDFVKDYECPVCALKAWLIDKLGLKESPPEKLPFFESIVQEMKLKGLCTPDWNFLYDAKQGGVANDDMLKKAVSGTEFPAYNLATEICAICGTVYAKHLSRGKIRKQLDLIVPNMPNRQMRRHPQDGMQLPPNMNNPLLS